MQRVIKLLSRTSFYGITLNLHIKRLRNNFLILKTHVRNCGKYRSKIYFLQSQIWKSVDESSVSSMQSLDGDTDIRHFTMQRDTSLDRSAILIFKIFAIIKVII